MIPDDRAGPARYRSLHDRVLEDGPLTHRAAAPVALALVRAFRAAHAAGGLRTDVTPLNVLIADDGRLMLTGFGPVGAGAAHVGAGTQQLLGPPHYLAPERLRGGAPTESADLWSLGATLYTAVEGRPPLSRDSVAGSWEAVLTDVVDPPRRPGPLHPVIARLLVRDPGQRASAAAIEAALRALTTRAVGVASVPAPDTVTFAAGAAAPVVLVDDDVAEAPPPPRPPRRGARFVVAGIAVLATATIGTATALAYAETRPLPGSSPASTGPPLTAGPCAGTTPRPLTDSTPAPPPAPPGWRTQDDPAGFSLPVPSGWTRAARSGVVCFSDPGGVRVFTVDSVVPVVDSPLLYWQAAEITALQQGTPAGYQRVSLADTGREAYWEYTWQPAAGPRLHTRWVLREAGNGNYDELSWTTRDSDWASNTDTEGSFVDGFRSSAAPT